jgi:MinD superfamily P-loop ATPase
VSGNLIRIAIASGKGGTGKTTVSTNLALAATRRGLRVAYIDCDVEEPNGQLFLKPLITSSKAIGRSHPSVDETKCAHCGLCGEICQFSAIVSIGEKVLVYPDLCHACGGCILVCRSGAITEVVEQTGTVETGTAGAIRFVQGTLRIGEAMSTPLIRQVKGTLGNEDLAILDCPPGTSCPVIESVRGADLVLLVTEPTPFGLNDLRLAVEMVDALHLPQAVVINRAGIGDRKTHEFCHRRGIPIWAEIPDDRRVAESYSRGELVYDAVPEFHVAIEQVLDKLSQRDRKESPMESGAARR